MRKLFCISLSIAAVVLQGIEARASTMNVTYLLSGTVLNSFAGVLSPNVSGVMQVAYNSATGPLTSGAAGSVLHGPVQLLGGSLMVPILFNKPVFTGFTAMFSGMATGGFVQAGLAGLSSGVGKLRIPIAGGVGPGTLHCTGPGPIPYVIPVGACTAFGRPNSLVLPTGFALNAVLTKNVTVAGALLPVINFNPIPAGTFFVPTGPPPAGLHFNNFLHLTATEINRHYVPEPSTLPLMGMGLVLLGVAGRAIRRR